MADSRNMKYLLAASAIALYFTVSAAAAEGESDCPGKESCINKPTVTLPLKIGAIASIFVGITIGVCLPLLGRTFTYFKPNRNTVFVIRAFAAGLVLATVLVQFLPDVFESPTSESPPWHNCSLPGIVAMFTALCTILVDALATGYCHLKNKNKPTDEGKELPGNGEDLEGQAHGFNTIDEESRFRHRVISLVLELAIIAQSAIVGISLGGAESPWMIVMTLVAAFTFQQFLEGLGLGGCLIQEGFNNKFPAVSTVNAFLAGVTAGMGLLSSESSPTAVMVETVFNMGSAGILVYMCLVDLFAAYIFKSKIQKGGALQIWAYMAFLLGLGAFFLVTKRV